MSVFGQIVDEMEEEYSQLYKDYMKVCDLLLDAYLMGFNSGVSRGRSPEFDDCGAQQVLEELVKEEGLDPKVVLRRLYCPQQTEENGECTCE
jgi:hypothetical protein